MKKISLCSKIISIVGISILTLFIIALGYYKFQVIGGEIIEVEANPEKGFNFNYYVYLPYGMKESEVEYLLVETNNAGNVSDDHKVHDKDAYNLIKNGIGHMIATNLKIPLLVPVFDRPESDWQMYTHALDRDTLMNNKGKLARIDLQLINMIGDIKERLKDKNIVVQDKIFMSGFSASGSFVNRFTALHPEIVQAVAAGGVNCMPIIPAAEWDEQKLIYPIGVYDINQIAGIEFNIDKYKKVSQYIYMGSLDDNDTLPYDDAFDSDERELIINFLGTDMHERWEKSKNIYQQLDVPATMVMYDDVGHETNDVIIQDIVNFFRAQSAE
ncbi:MAG: hypothetical protein H6Q69_2862 [Firmicutes bacterium]|nr:hypothetical protein [Bacillota bacterium]